MELYKDLAIRAVRYQTDREEKRIAFVVGGVAVARAMLIVVVVVPARDGSGSGDGYQNCACHYNFKAGFPRSLVVGSGGRRRRRDGGTTGRERGRGRREDRRERYAVDIGRGTGRRRWKRMAAAVTATEAGRPRRTAGLRLSVHAGD